MLQRVVAAIVVACSLAVVAFASTDNAIPRSHDNPYADKYARNLVGMSLPDQTLDGVRPPNADVAFAHDPEGGAQASKTCSQRCSTTCTTTRGCKRQTDGCSGGSTPASPPPYSTPSQPLPAAVPLMSAPTATAVQLTQDLTALTTVNAQRALVIAGYEGLCVTGTIAPAFDVALKDFQSRHRIAATGVLTLETWQVLQPLLLRASRQ